jgi:hypothetical protein
MLTRKLIIVLAGLLLLISIVVGPKVANAFGGGISIDSVYCGNDCNK